VSERVPVAGTVALHVAAGDRTVFGAVVALAGDLLYARIARHQALPEVAHLRVRAELAGVSEVLVGDALLESQGATGTEQLEAGVRLLELRDDQQALLREAARHAADEGLLGPDSWLDEPHERPPPSELGAALLGAVGPATTEPRRVHWAPSGERVTVMWGSPEALALDWEQGLRRGRLALELPFRIGQRTMLRTVLPDGQTVAVRARYVDEEGVRTIRFRLVPAMRAKLTRAAGLRGER